jgi:hypothetical protein
MLNGSTTRSPALIDFTAGPTCSITPRFSWPKIVPGSVGVRPSYMCRSLPQIAAVVSRSTASVASSIFVQPFDKLRIELTRFRGLTVSVHGQLLSLTPFVDRNQR